MNRIARYRASWTVATLFVFALLASVSRGQVVPAARRITTAINEAERVPLAASVPVQIKRAKDMGAVAWNTPARHMVMVLTRNDDREQALVEYLSDVQNAASPSFHKWLTPAQYGARFGASTDDVATLSGWLQSQGFTIDKTPVAGNVISFSGNVAQVQKAFSTTIHTFTVDGVKHMANATVPQVPRAFASAVRGLVGLDDFHPHSLMQKGPTGTFNPVTKKIRPDFTLFSNTGTPYLYVDPADAATIYNVPNTLLNPNYTGTTYDGTGVTVGIVGDSNVDLTGVSLYRQDFLGETSANVNLPTIIVDGADPGINGDEGETFLDLEVLGGIAPKAKINYYASDDSDLSSGLFNAIQRAIDDDMVSVLSISYGACESGLGPQTSQYVSELYQQAAAQGITVSVSSGDSGAAGCDLDGSASATQGLAVNGLASTPYNVSVGGTDFDVLAANFSTYVQDSLNGVSYSGIPPYWRTALSYIPEEPWNDSTASNGALADNTPFNYGGSSDIIAGGGGVSNVFAKPAFQTALTPKDGQRDVPDVALLAGNGLYGAVWLVCGSGSAIAGPDCQETNGNFTSSSTFSGAGGTSAAAPAFSAMMALLVQATGSRQGQVNNTLYQLAANKYGTVFNDVTTGNNAVVCTSGSPNCGSNGFTAGYDAVTGYDTASGLGSVNAAAMIANWSSVKTAGTTTSLTIDGATAPISVTHGASLNFAVGVTPVAVTGTAALVTTATVAEAGSPTLNGQVAIPLTSGAGTISYNGLPGGVYTVYARYSGDTADASSSSTPINVNIAAEVSSTLLSVNVYGPTGASITNLSAVPYGSYIFSDPSVYGTAEGYNASLGLATGSFAIQDGGKPLGTAYITSSNLGSFPSVSAGVYPYAVGMHKITAAYAGDASYKANTSNEVDFTVVKGTTGVTVTPTSASIQSVASDQIQVTVTSSSLALSQTGTLTLTANGQTLASSSNLTSGQAFDGSAIAFTTFNIQGSQLAAGANTITATYSGDSNYQGSNGTATVTVQEAGFSLKAGPITVAAGSTTGNTSTITASPSNGFAGVINLTCSVTASPANATSPITCSVPATLNVTGTRAATGTLTVSSTASTTGGAYTVTISGTDAASGKIAASTIAQVTVSGPAPAASIALTNSGALTFTAGATTANAATISATPSGGFTGAVGLTCAVTTAPAGATDPVTCALNPASVTIAGMAVGTSMLTVTSTARSSASLGDGPLMMRGIGGTFVAIGIFFFVPSKRRRSLSSLAVLLTIVALGSLSGCGGGGKTSGGAPPVTGTTAGAYVITVTSSATGVAVETTTVNVTVN